MILKVQGRSEMERLLWVAMYTPGPNGRWGLPLVPVGKPGTGKTAIMKQVTKAAGLHFEGVISSLREPADFLGLPVPSRMKLTEHTQVLSPDGDSEIVMMKYAPAQFAVRATLARRSVIFLDEVNTAPPAVQAALLRLINEGFCGELELPPTVRFMCAMNQTSQAAGGWDVAPPLANRVGWIDWEMPDSQQFAAYLMGSQGSDEEKVDPRKIEDAVKDAWPSAWAKYAGLLAGYVMAKPDALHRMPAEGSPQTSAAWPSHRTNEMAAMALAGAEIWGLSEKESFDLATAFIGAAASGELYSYRKNNDLPNPEELLDGKVKYTHNKARIDRTAAVLASCTSLLTNKQFKTQREDKSDTVWKPRIEKMWELLMTLADEAADLCLGSTHALMAEKLILGSQVGYRVISKLAPVLVAAGYTVDRV